MKLHHTRSWLVRIVVDPRPVLHGRAPRSRAIPAAAAVALAAMSFLESPFAETRILEIGTHPLAVEVAVTDRQQRRGLMGRKQLSENTGMLFVWNDEALRVMWMKNTLIPLSVAFVDAEGEIVNIERMVPETTTPHWSKRAARYAIEARQGWFRDRGIGNGDRVDGLEPH